MALYILFGILAVFLIVLLLRARVLFEYSEFMPKITISFATFKYQVYPQKDNSLKLKIEKPKPAKDKNPVKDAKVFIKPITQAIRDIFGSLKMELLELKYIAASCDAAQTALLFGSTVAGISILLPIFENTFDIEKKNIDVKADFEAKEPFLYIYSVLSLAIWQIIFIGVRFAYIFYKEEKLRKY